MARHGENIYLRKDGRYEGRYIKGRRQDGALWFGYVYAARYAEVKRKLIVLKATEENAVCAAYQNGTVGEWIEYWLAEHVKPYVCTSTYETYQSQINTHILPVFENRVLRKITTREIQDFVNDLRQRRSAGMVHNVTRLLSSVFRAAQNKGLSAINPCEGVRKPKNKAKPPRVLTCGEQAKLERMAMDTGSLEYLLCLYTGLRLGELCALKWEDIDMDGGVIYVRAGMKRLKSGVVQSTPKTQSSQREIPVPVFIMRMLRQNRGQADGYVFVNAKGGAADMRTIQLRLRRMAKKLGLKGVHMHTLRHTFATRCLESGIRFEALSELLGHSTPNITLTYYVHCTRESKMKSIQKLRRIAS
ncbi:MAG: site-specific integrase [Christensenella sp.]